MITCENLWGKLNARKTYLDKVSISETASKAEKNKAFKDIQKLNKILEELEERDRAVLYPKELLL